MADKSVSVYTIDGAGTIREWSEVVNLNFSKPTDLHYSVDYDLGIVKMGGYSAPDLVLYSAVDLDDTIIKVHLDTDVMASYPDQGVIQIELKRSFTMERVGMLSTIVFVVTMAQLHKSTRH